MNIFKVGFKLLFTFLFINLNAQNKFDDEVICKHFQPHKHNFNQIKIRRSQAGRFIDVKKHKMHFYIDPSRHYINGKVQTTFITNDDVFGISFDLMDNMQIDSILYKNAKVPFIHKNNEILISLLNLLPKDSKDSVTIFYQGKPIVGSFGHFVSSKHSGVPVLHTLSEPYGAMNWWPCKQTLDDKIEHVEITVDCPKEYRTASIGLLTEDRLINSSTRRNTWKSNYPIAPYLVAIAVTNYTVFTDTANLTDGKVPIVNYVYPETLTKAKNDYALTAQMMVLFDTLFGPYPFSLEKYGHASFNRNGGMEHQTMSFMGNFKRGLIAHELAHQWFGDQVTCGSWQDLWLNESFATYLTELTYLYIDKNEAKFNSQMLKIRDRAMKEPGGSVWIKAKDTLNISRLFSSRLTYRKGAVVLNMLRWKIGDHAFYKGVKQYLLNNAYRFARTNDLIFELEKSSGENLDDFFNDWIYGEGYPIYTFYYEQVGNELSIQVKQNQSVQSVPFFNVPLPFRILDINGNKQQDIVIHPKYDGEKITIKTNINAEKLVFDIDKKIMAKAIVLPRNLSKIDLVVRPNPARNYALIRSLNSPIINIELYNTLGQKIRDISHLKIVNNDVKLQVDNLKAGLYIIKVKLKDGNRADVKFIKV